MNKKEREFIEKVWKYYRREGRYALPWRKTKNPYRILVSEVMLQQTQVGRVIPKYRSFLTKFPTVRSLASEPLGEVLREWQGLGYNRRAKMLHECAREVVLKQNGKLPRTRRELVSLPGIGDYTAGAILAFAYNIPIPIIETNIRTVIIHHFFKDSTDVSDREILACVERTFDRKNPREWYYALMDYGAHLKSVVGNQNTRSKHYTKQSTFRNSDRQIRGAIVRLLTEGKRSRKMLEKELSFDKQRIDEQVEALLREEMIVKKRGFYQLP